MLRSGSGCKRLILHHSTAEIPGKVGISRRLVVDPASLWCRMPLVLKSPCNLTDIEELE